jgi:predicted nuclease of predicted toxin-antitoxin system
MLGLHTVPDALRAAGVKVECKTDHYDQETPDSVWVPEVGARGWIILTADKNIRHNLIELAALLKSGTHSFILTSGNCTGPEIAKSLVAALPQIMGIVATIPPPAIGTVSKAGKVRVVATHDDLIAQVGKMQARRPPKKTP